MRSGVGASASFGWETTWGTAVTAGDAIPIISESMRVQDPRITDRSTDRLYPGTSGGNWVRGKPLIHGQVTMPLWSTGIEELLRVASGEYAWNAIDSLHEFPFYWLWEDRGWTQSFTMTISVGDANSTDTWKTYAGCVVSGHRLNVRPGDMATITFDIVAKTETIATTGPVTSLATSGEVWTGGDNTLRELYGSTLLDVRRLEVSCQRHLDIGWNHGSDSIREPLHELSKPQFTAKVVIGFETTDTLPDWYELLYRGATPYTAILDMQFTNPSAEEFHVAAPAARVMGSTPLVLGPGGILADIDLELMSSTLTSEAPLTYSITGTGTL